MSRSSVSPSLVTMMSRCAGAGGGSGRVSAGGGEGLSVLLVSVLARVELRRGGRVPRRRAGVAGAAAGFSVGAESLVAAVSSAGLASVLSVGVGAGCAALSLGRGRVGAG